MLNSKKILNFGQELYIFIIRKLYTKFTCIVYSYIAKLIYQKSPKHVKFLSKFDSLKI